MDARKDRRDLCLLAVALFLASVVLFGASSAAATTGFAALHSAPSPSPSSGEGWGEGRTAATTGFVALQNASAPSLGEGWGEGRTATATGFAALQNASAPSPSLGEGWGEGLSAATTGFAAVQNGGQAITGHVPFLPPGLRPPFWNAQRPAQGAPQPAAQTSAPLTIPTAADIDVAFLSRDPLYPPYQVDYPDGWTPLLRPGSENDKHWPEAGEPVTFTAHVANRGVQPAGAFAYRWRLDGQAVLSGTVPSLAPGQWISLTLPWSWQDERRWVAFEADTGSAVAEISKQNNKLEEATDAIYLDIRVHPYVYQAFAQRLNLVGSFTFEDWLQAQVAQMNQRFAQAIYAEAPQGIVDRVRINAIRVVTDVNSSLPDYDGGWGFGVAADDPDTAQNESVESAENYAQAFALSIDWGLIHELTHQLGFIDLYNIGVPPERVLLPGKDGLPLLMTTRCRNCDMMGGGDTAPHNIPSYYSSYAAAAINRNHGYRRGYYGEFMFDVPLTNVLVLRDNAGAPLVGAQVEVYQTGNGSLPPTPVISGVTDGDGVFILPNRPISVEVTTATGHTLRPNPFGRINVVGTNVLLLFKVSRSGNEDYTWRSILDFNLAYWAGITQTFTITWPTHLPSLAAPAPLQALTGRFEMGQASLSWSPQPGVAAYRVYQANDPYDRWDLLGQTTGITFTATPTWSSRYGVTMVDAGGRESGFAPIYRAFYWVYPHDALYRSDLNRWLVLDGHSGSLVEILPDGRVVGNLVSGQSSYVGGQALSYTPEQSLAIMQESQATVFNQDLHRIGYIGRTDWDPPPIDQATGVLLAGDVFSTTIRPEGDAQTLFLAHFDGDLSAGGAPPLVATATFTPGISGQAVAMGPASRLVYTGTGYFDEVQGGLDFWLRPDWDGEEQGQRVFFSAGDGQRYLFEVGAVGGYLYVYVTKFDGYNATALWQDIRAWQQGEWHHVGVSWLPHWLKLYVDGEMADLTVLRRPITGTLGMLTIGSNFDGSDPALATMDEVRVSSVARVGNSDRVRLLVSEERNGVINLLDLMGNVAATFSDAQVKRPRGLAARPDGKVAVADAADGTVKLLGFDGGDTLTYQSTFVSGLASPHNILSLAGRLAVPDYGNGVVKLFGPDGGLETAYSRPNDGYPGVFGGPYGVAAGPAGDLLVADEGKRRVVFIRHALLDRRRYLPLVLR